MTQMRGLFLEHGLRPTPWHVQIGWATVRELQARLTDLQVYVTRIWMIGRLR